MPVSLTLDFKDAHDTAGLTKHEDRLLVLYGPERKDGKLEQCTAYWDGKKFCHYEQGHHIATAREYAVVKHPALPVPKP